ncbi:IS3 family transposase [Defluviitalea raffinosedens]|uniref:IS3 family transposase n=1 Tax=Defluviitalea raffinosedens TaxID=1450156 RepID=UPI001FA9E40A|nr:IS3 family transposase [Defluviitalea raffinosedens]
MSGKKKYSDEFKLAIVSEYLDGHTGGYRALAAKYGINPSIIKNWVALYKNGGIDQLINARRTFSGDFKIHVVEYMHQNSLSIRSTAALFGVQSPTTVSKWERTYYEEGKEALYEERRGRSRKMSTKKPRKDKKDIKENEDLLAEVQRLRMENEYLKKFECLNSRAGKVRTEEKVAVISELRQKYPLEALLKLAGVARSTYYYYLKRAQRPDKYRIEKDEITAIYHEHQGRYGYRRITLEMRNRGYVINHKTVQRLMKQLKLKCQVRIKKYRSYKGEIGKVAPNLINRDFHAIAPNQKWTTDITEFSLFGKKLYLSPVLDMYNSEIISYSISDKPYLGQVIDMLDKAFAKIPDGTGLIFHSDQGWQYQHKQYQRRLKEKGIVQSMSRKGNCLDNAIMENFFGLLKSELLYLREFKDINEFRDELEKYIYYYNNHRIKGKLKGLSPVQYRVQTQIVA